MLSQNCSVLGRLRFTAYRPASVALIAWQAYVGQLGSGNAETLTLDPLMPEIIVNGVPFTPTVVVSTEVNTTRFAFHVSADVTVSADRTKLESNINTIVGKILPIKIQGGPCEFEIQNIKDLMISVSGQTGIVKIISSVEPANCPLTSGDVSITAHFIPLATSTTLSLDIVGMDVGVPFWWQVAGFVGGKKPEDVIKINIKAQIARLILNTPKIDHVKIAFQGVSLDAKSGAIIVRLRSDALADPQAVTAILSKWDAMKKILITIP